MKPFPPLRTLLKGHQPKVLERRDMEVAEVRLDWLLTEMEQRGEHEISAANLETLRQMVFTVYGYAQDLRKTLRTAVPYHDANTERLTDMEMKLAVSVQHASLQRLLGALGWLPPPEVKTTAKRKTP